MLMQFVKAGMTVILSLSLVFNFYVRDRGEIILEKDKLKDGSWVRTWEGGSNEGECMKE